MQLCDDGYYELKKGKLASIVTYLAMLQRPAARPGPARPDLTLRRVVRPEPGWYRELYGRIGRDWLWFSRLAMPEAELAAIVHDPAVEVRALVQDGRDEGLLELDRRAPAEVELAFFGLTPALVGGGAGRWLMDRAIELAWKPGVRRFWVHTCNLDHPAALGFYVRSGFTAYAQAVEIADDPRLTGVLPRDAAPWVPLIE